MNAFISAVAFVLTLVSGVASGAPRAYIANDGNPHTGNTVSVIETATSTVVGAPVVVGPGPTGVAVHPAGTRVYVTNFGGGSNTVSVIDTATQSTIATVAVGSSPFSVAVNATGTHVYVSNLGGNSVSVIDTSNNTVIATVPVDIGPIGLALSTDGNRMFVLTQGGTGQARVSAINTTDFSVTAGSVFGNTLSSVTQIVAATASRVYVTASNDNKVYVIDAIALNQVGEILVGGRPGGITKFGSKVYVANDASGTVSVIDTVSNTVSATASAGPSPNGMSVTPDGSRLYVANRVGSPGTVTVLDTATLGIVATINVGDFPVSFGNFIVETGWRGSAGSVVNPSTGQPEASSPTVVGNGTTGAAVFTYQTVNSFCCHTGNWTFETTAATSGNVPLNWTYSGYHGTCQAHASLTAFVKHSGVTTNYPVYSATDSCSGQLPSAGFGERGQVVLPSVVAGDTYGFTMNASNFDSNGGVGGKLTVTIGTSVTTTALGSSANPAASGATVNFTATVNGVAPGDSVLFTREGRPLPGCERVPVVAGSATCATNFLFVGNNHIIAHYTGDSVNAGSTSTTLTQVINAAQTATTTSLASSANPAIVGTPVTLTAAVTGTNPTGTVSFADASGPIAGCTGVALTGAGNVRNAACITSSLAVGAHGIVATYGGDAFNFGSSSATTNQIIAIAAVPTLFLTGQIDPTGTAFRAFGNVPGVAGALGSAPAEYVTGNTCVNGALSGGQPHSGTAYFGNDGYFILDLTATHDQFIAVRMLGSLPTVLSNCVPALGDNDAWPRARELSNMATASDTDVIDQSGRARWFKFRVIPGQTVSVNLAGLPADYDLALFKDIGAAYLAQITAPPATAQDVGKLSAEFAPSAFSPSAFSPSAFSPSAFSPSAFSPSAFSPSAFSPSAFSPSAFSPSAFSPSAFSPSAFSPSAFSPSAFSPSAFSPSAFSPSAFSPSAFSPSAFSPSAFSPSAFSPIAQAFAAAQTQSIVAVSATPGLSNESVMVNTWTNTGYFYVRVTGRGTASSSTLPFQLTVSKDGNTCANVSALTAASRSAPSGNYTTLIITDSAKLALDAPLTTGGALRQKLTLFAGANQAALHVMDSGPSSTDTRLRTLRSQAEANKFCPYAMNLLAEEIKSIVDAYRASNPTLKYIVLAGADDVIPFFRYPDETLLGKESGYVPPVIGASDASLRQDYVLSQDAYGATRRVSMRLSDFPVPGLAVGRLVKTPDQIAGMLDAYTQDPLTPQSALVTGYDFLSDVANQVQSEFSGGLPVGAQVDSLISPSTVAPLDLNTPYPAGPWTASDLRQKLLGQTRHDLVFIAGHFSANSALAADFTTSLLTTDLATATTNFTNSIVFSPGCHSGYNIVAADAVQGVTLTLDWAEAFAIKKATLIAGTGYQYGDTDFIEYSERIYLNLAKALRTGSRVNVGDALVKAKLDYLAITPDIRGLHHKAMLEATLYGLPMLGVTLRPASNATNVVAANVDPAPVNAGTPGAALNLRTAELKLGTGGLAMVAADTPKTLDTIDAQGLKQPGPTAHWLSGPDGLVTANAFEPVLPLNAYDVTPPLAGNLVLRGVGFREADFTVDSVLPLTGAPATEIRGVHVPFASPYFYPMRLWTPNYWGLLSNDQDRKTSLLVTPAQHRSDDPTQNTSTRRTYTGLKLQLYYSGAFSGALAETALADAPTIVSVTSTPLVNNVLFTVKAVANPTVGVQQVWITFLDGSSWRSTDLQQCVIPLPLDCGNTADSTTWVGRLGNPAPTAGVPYIAQAVNGIGLVAMDDNHGAYYLGTSAAPAATTLAVAASASGGVYGSFVPVTVTLSSPVQGASLSDKTVTATIGGGSASGRTGPGGTVTFNVPLTALPGNYPIVAAFAGDASTLPSSASTAAGSFNVAKAPSTLSQFTGSYTTMLTAQVGAAQRPLLQEAVRFNFLNGSNQIAGYAVANTDLSGVATLPPVDVPPGTYTIAAQFSGDSTFLPTSNGNLGSVTVQTQQITFSGSGGGNGLPDSILVNGSATFTVNSTSSQPVIIAVAPPPDATTPVACSITQTGANTYSLTGLARGLCTVTASANAASNFASASTSSTIPIQSTQTVSLPALADKTYGDSAFPITATGTGPMSNAITFTATGPCTATAGANPTTVSITGAGLCTLTATQAASQFYRVGSITASFTVAAAAQTIVFANPGAKTLGSAPFTLQATGGGSGNPIVFSTPPNSNACSVSGSTLTITSTGSCTVRANQAGNNNYNPAPQVVQTFLIDLADVWTPTGMKMTTPRANHTATRLLDGRVVIAGGEANDKLLSSTEIYDPVARTFTAAGNLHGKSSNHAATLLADGRVLAVGGGNSSSELFNPATNTWTAVGGGSNRSFHTMTRLLDGRVLIVGGADNAGTTLSSTLIFNPTNNTFTAGPQLDTPRERHAAILLNKPGAANHGKVLIVGGRAKSGSTYTTLATYQLCDAVACTVSTTPSVPIARYGHSAAALMAADNTTTDKVIVAGGANGSTLLADATLYDVASGAWSNPTGTLSVARSNLRLSELPNSRALAAGGHGKASAASAATPQRAVDLYQSQLGFGALMNVARSWHTATPLRDANNNIIGVLVTGGRTGTSASNEDDDSLPSTDVAEVYGVMP